MVQYNYFKKNGVREKKISKKIFITKIFNTVNQRDTIFALPRQEQGVIRAITP